MNKNSVNKPLIIFSTFASVILAVIADAGDQLEIASFEEGVLIIVIVLILYPFISMWLKALWNEIAHKIFNLPIINSWQAAGILALIFLLFAA